MKKLILIALLVCFTTYGQDAEFFNKIRNLDEVGVENLAIELAGMTRNQFKIDSKQETDEGIVITFAKSDLSTDDVVLKVVFEKFMEGENKALEVKGVKKYSFYGVTYNYLDLFPFWQKYFSPNATKESVLTNYSQQKSELKTNGNWWLYKFQNDGSNPKIWTLRKFY